MLGMASGASTALSGPDTDAPGTRCHRCLIAVEGGQRCGVIGAVLHQHIDPVLPRTLRADVGELHDQRLALTLHAQCPIRQGPHDVGVVGGRQRQPAEAVRLEPGQGQPDERRVGLDRRYLDVGVPAVAGLPDLVRRHGLGRRCGRVGRAPDRITAEHRPEHGELLADTCRVPGPGQLDPQPPA